MKTEKTRYLWIRPNSIESPMLIIDDPEDLFRGSKFDESVDKLYQIGSEVKNEGSYRACIKLPHTKRTRTSRG